MQERRWQYVNTCEVCRSEFPCQRRYTRFCSHKCRSVSATKARTCEGCGREFKPPGRQSRKRWFCSKQCRRDVKKRQCQRCGNEFPINGEADKQVFCTPVCAMTSRRRDPTPCSCCGKEVPRRPRTKRGRRASGVYCSSDCVSAVRYPRHSVLCETCKGNPADCGCRERQREAQRSLDRGDAWQQAIRGELQRVVGTEREKAKRDVWARKIQNVIAGHRIRERCQSKGERRCLRPPPTTIEEAIVRAERSARSRAQRQIKMMDPWNRKCETVARNHRRKAQQDGRGQCARVESTIGATAVQMRFDWS